MKKEKRDTVEYNEFFNVDFNSKGENKEGPSITLDDTLSEEKKSLPYFPDGDSISPEDDLLSKIKGFIHNGTMQKPLKKVTNIYPLQAFSFLNRKKSLFVGDYPLVVKAGSLRVEKLLDVLSQKAEEITGKSELVDYFNSLLPKAIQNVEPKNKALFDSEKLKSTIRSLSSEMKNKGFAEKKIEILLTGIYNTLDEFSSIITLNKYTSYSFIDLLTEEDSSGEKEFILRRVEKLKSELKAKLEIEKKRQKGDTSDEFGLSGDFLEFDTINSYMPDTTTQPLDENIISQINSVLETLNNYDLEKRYYLFADKALEASINYRDAKFEESEELLKSATISAVNNGQEFLNFMKALKTGELIAKDRYQPGIHKAYFDNISLSSLSEEDRSFIPKYVVIASSSNLHDSLMLQYIKAVKSGYPIKLLLLENTHKINKSSNELDIEKISIANRNCFVFANSLLKGKKVFEDLTNAFKNNSAGLFVLKDPEHYGTNLDIFKESLEIESRIFPIYSYTLKANQSNVEGFSLLANPDYEKLLSSEKQSVIIDGEKAELNYQITPADYLLLEKSFHDNFAVMPDNMESDMLVHFSEFLNLPKDEWYHKIPYIYGVDAEGKVVLLSFRWRLFQRSIEILSFWQYLQENAGINNKHVINALEKQNEELEEIKAKEIEALKSEFEKKLNKVRDQSYEEAIERITSALLNENFQPHLSNVDDISDITTSANEVESKEETLEKTEEKVTESEKEAEEEIISEEPWIETPMCTSCNDCININNKLFKYNEDNMAFIDDPKAGTYADLVMAAEKCPAGIIHPGKPMNPDEPNLEELIKKAEKYN